MPRRNQSKASSTQRPIAAAKPTPWPWPLSKVWREAVSSCEDGATLTCVNDPHAASGGDPAEALSRKGCLVLLTGGFLLIQVPRAVAGMVNGDSADRLNATLSLTFAAWLTWRATVLFREPRSALDRRYWTVSAVG